MTIDMFVREYPLLSAILCVGIAGFLFWFFMIYDFPHNRRR